ncbi:MAG: DUF1570 domain-containing protein [Chlamydiae bacterium]|nr:DUF1570 domain-containing protein [Chlamydiota bacterium]MBI3265725.1 DUF1570 domain-containing protein [Chlamydiota bacterium]
MKTLLRLTTLIAVIVGTGLFFENRKKEESSTRSLQVAFKKSVIPSHPTSQTWDEKTLQLRHGLAMEAQVAEKFISLEDVEFKQDFPSFTFVKTPVYSILTEKKSFAFQNALQTLLSFETQFRGTFSMLLSGQRGLGLQVVFFDSEKTFQEFRRKNRVPEWVCGFYNFKDHRLYLYNALDITKSTSPLAHVKIPFRYQEILLPTLTGQMDQTLSLMRHEATHQLSAQYNILPKNVASWLLEGWAVYCEKAQIGLPHRQYMLLLAYLPPMKVSELMSIRSFLGLNENQALDAYATSWCLIYYLMQSPRQTGFYQFLKQVQNHPEESTQIAILARNLRTTPEQLEKDFQNFRRQMAKR